MTEMDWKDGFLVSVAAQLVSHFRWEWSRLTKKDPGLRQTDFTQLFDGLTALGLPVEIDGPDDLPYPDEGAAEAARPLVDSLRKLVARLRSVGATVFTGPEDLPDNLLCVLDRPRKYFGVPPPSRVADDEPRILKCSDLPEEDPEWQKRSQIARFRELRVLYLAFVHLSSTPLEVELGRLQHLVALDLADNQLATLPKEVADCRTLEWLSLAQNPIAAAALAPLRSLWRLRYLGLIRTGVSPADLEIVQAIVPAGCVVDLR